MRTSNIDARIYKLYILCLPFGKLFNIDMGDFVNKIITQFSTYVMLLGVFMLISSNQFSLRSQRIRMFNHLYLFMMCYSILASCVLVFTLDTQHESPLYTILGDIVLYFLVLLSIVYNWHNLTYNVKISDLYKVFDIQVVCLLIIGYAQFFGMLGFTGPYNILSQVFALQDLSWLTNVDRGVTFFGIEPSSAAILCSCVIPYIYTCIASTKGYKKFLYMIVIILFLPLFFGSNSSQLLIMFSAATLLFVWIILKKNIPRSFYYGSFAVGLFFALSYVWTDSVSIAKSDDTSSIEYALLNKFIDRENQSTATRASTVINDLKIIADNPLTGVGNGNQGFFYEKNIPSWVINSAEVQQHITSRTIVNGGGNFFPSFFSGFGLIGLFFLIAFIKKYKKAYASSFLQLDGRAKTIFQISIILFLFASWHVVGVKQTETIIFILSLPCVAMYNQKEYKR